jgi:K+-sensing histidine kinase KdpD
MFHIKGPILAAIDLNKGADEILRQADALARSYNVKLFVCHVPATDRLRRVAR